MRPDDKHLQDLIEHISHVRENCIKLGLYLIQEGEVVMGRMLIVNGHKHDLDKFTGIQWECLRKGAPQSPSLTLAIQDHNHTNLHHPEAWSGIKCMPRLYLAEFVCDIKARSGEFGSSLKEFIERSAMNRYGFTKEDEVYKVLMRYHDVLCDVPFERAA